jgi:hypothetical protein
MKNFLLFIVAALFIACESDKLNDEIAKTVVESLINNIANAKYEEANNLYSTDFQKAESLEARKVKFEVLNASLGKLISMEVADIKNEQPTGEESRVTLTYSVKHERKNSRESFIVIKDEGEYRVAAHNIVSE